jgi:hypothetical protein
MAEPKKMLSNYTANLSVPSPLTLQTVPLSFKVPDECAGMRLDQVLAKLLPEYSRGRLQDWITQQQVLLDGAAATSKQKVWGGEKIEVILQSNPAEQPYQAETSCLKMKAYSSSTSWQA